MAVPFVSLDAATATGPGESRDLGELADHHTLITTATGGDPGGNPGPDWTVVLQGSHDGTAWVTLASATGSSPNGIPVVSAATAPASTSPGHLVRYVRANLTALSGGSSPAVTATIASDTTGED